MKAKMLAAAAYPPPPPPQKSRKLLVVALLLIIIVVSAGVLVYLAMGPSSTEPTPQPSASPTPTHTATPTPTHTATSTPTHTATPTSSPTSTPTPQVTSTPPPTSTPTPSGSNPLVNFRAGAWAEYVMRTYEAGEVTSEGTMKYSVDEGTYSGVACWLLTMEMTMSEGAYKTVVTYWMNKNTLEGIHVKTQVYINGELYSEHEEDITPGEEPGDMPKPPDLNMVTGHETITVPAGEFDCDKVTITSTVEGKTTVMSEWVNSGIPVLGLVKMEITSDGALYSTTELIDYGG